MSDAKFVPDVAPLSLAEIAELTGAVLSPGADAGLRIGNIAALDRAGPGDLAFIDSVKYAGQLRETRAGACLASARFEKQAPAHVAVLRAREPYRAFITVARKLFPGMLRPTSVFATTGIAPGATVHPSARLEAGVTVDPGVVIGPQAEIGAGSTIDRGAIRDTMIGEGTKIDNLVQIGHNVVIGRHCVIVAQTGISGSSTLEDFVALGARVGVTNHVTIGEGAQIAAISIVGGDVPPGARWGGTPAKPVKQWLREVKVLEHLAQNRRASEDGDDEQDPAA